MLNESTQNRWYELLRVTRSWRLEWHLEQLLQRVTKEAVEFLEFDRGILFLLSADGLSRRAQFLKEGATPFDETRHDIEQIADKVVQTGRPVFAHVVGKGGEDKPNSSGSIGDAYCVPLTAGRGILGALYVDSQGTGKRDKQNQEVLEMLGLQAAASLDHAMLYHSAITDPLTGLYSHRHFQQEVEQAVRRALRSSQTLSLFILDLDHFKALNDSEGHEVGNTCLVQVAQLLRSTLRSADVIARFGGDEFEVLLPDTPLQDAFSVAEKIRLKIEKLRFGKDRHVAGTIGIAAFPDNAADAQQLFLRADEALYYAKEGGRNQSATATTKVDLPRRESMRGEGAARSQLLASVPQEDRHAPPPENRAVPERVATEQIDGYSLVRRLGIGSMGEVLLVRQEELEREVALKRPLTPHLTAEQVHAFEREAKITASLNHPGVITVFTLGRDSDGRRYYTMKPLQGMSLAEALERRRKEDPRIARSFTLSRLLEIVQRVAETIAYAHQRNIFHLDLTPANVVLGEFGEVTVIDWGASASTASRGGINYHLRGRTSANGKLTFLVGSAGSLAPEQLPGSKRKPNAATDVHALGALLYEVLTGRGPYDRDNTHDVLDAILDGTIMRPEKVVPKAGIDPTLSALCMSALSKDPRNRPTSAEFAQRLGRYVRRETEFTVTRFGPNDTPLDLNDWGVQQGSWKLVDGEFVSSANPGQSSTLYWKQSVPGAFRIVVEAWIETRGEIAVFGRHRGDTDPISAHLFQFGAEWNTCMKLGHTAAIAGRVPEPGRRYRMELEYHEGWVYCYLDGEKIFEHRELFHFPGNLVGLYTCDPGVHFKVLEVHRQTWGLTIPAVRLADAYFLSNQFERAAELYQELSDRLGDRLEGLEARLKLGITYASMKRKTDAQRVFQSLYGTMLEPFALGKEALLEFTGAPTDQPRRGIALLKTLLTKHPDSPARYAAVNAGFANATATRYSERIQLGAQVRDLARNSRRPPTMMEIGANRSYLVHLFSLGQYKKALTDALSYNQGLLPAQLDIAANRGTCLLIAVANGRDDLLTLDPFELQRWEYYDFEQPRVSPVFDMIVRQGKLDKFIADFEYGDRRPLYHIAAASHAVLLYTYIALGELKKVCECVERIILQDDSSGYGAGVVLAGLLDGAHYAEFEHYARRFETETPAGARYIPALRVRAAVERREFETAARLLHDWKFNAHDILGNIFTAFIASLDLLDVNRKELKESIEFRLAGTAQDLGRMLLGAKKPVPGTLWPHPQGFPHWRLWLALWLEARGKAKAAHAIVKPARDPRYLRSNLQPVIEALLKRTARKG